MTVIPSELQKKMKELKEQKKRQKYEMGMKQVRLKEDNYQKSLDSSNDDYMKDALAEVRKNKTTIDVDYARFNGTSYYTESQKDRELDYTQNDEFEVRNKPILTKKTKPKIVPNVDTKTRPKRPIIKVDKNKIIPTPINESMETLEKLYEQGYRFHSGSLLFGVKTKGVPKPSRLWGVPRTPL